MKRFGIYNASYNKKLPKISSIYAGYKGLDNGLAILWNRKMIVLIRPVNERE